MKTNRLGLNFSPNKAFYTSLVFFLISLLLLFSLFKKIAPLAIGHVVYYCQALFTGAVITLPHSLPSLFAILLLLVFATGIFIFIIQLIKVRIFVSGLLANRTPLKIKDKVDVVENSRCLAFCYGFFKPRIILSSKLVRILTEAELKAVLIHENYHLRNHDPLKIMLGQIAADMFWFLPVIKDFYNHFVILKEFSADQLVLDIQKSAKNLKLALAKIIDYPAVSSPLATFTPGKGLEARIFHLTNIKERPNLNISLARLIVSCLVILFIFVLLNVPIYEIATGKKAYAYVICPTGQSCANIPACSQEQRLLTFAKFFYYNK